MDYVVGSVAALVSGNVTPNRPRLLKRALTPTKHQASPNVTPKSEFVEDRSIFLSPSMQKKKAIVKKSPKRIFQNPDLETTDNGEGNISLSSPKADKVKKHLKDELDNDSVASKDPKSPKNKGKNKRESVAPEKSDNIVTERTSNENTPKKNKKKTSLVPDNPPESSGTTVTVENPNANKSPRKIKQKRKSTVDEDCNKENDGNITEISPEIVNKSPKKQTKSGNVESTPINNEVVANNVNNANPKKKNKKRKKKPKQQAVESKTESAENIAEEKKNDNEGKEAAPKKKNRKRKKSKSQQNKPEPAETEEPAPEKEDDDDDEVQNKKSKPTVNPNAITDKDSDSEHESDDEIESENEEINRKVFEAGAKADESSDEEEEEDDEEAKKKQPKKQKVEKKEVNKGKAEGNTEDEIKRTLFVGNVPFSAKCKKEIKKIFNKHGQIETIRIRTVPVKDGRYTPKLAVVKNELHPERTTVNVYIKYANEESVEKALAENNTVLNENHLRVSRSSHTGAEHDPKCSIFVGNLPFAIEDETLRQKFENCGEIESVRIIRDKKTSAGKGFGYVNFVSKDGVELALALTEEDLTIKNRIIRVKRCTQLTHKQKQHSDNKGFKKPFNQRVDQGSQRFQGGQRQNRGNQRENYGNQRQNQGNQRGFQRGNQNGPPSFQRGNQNGPPSFQRGNQNGAPSFQRGNQNSAPRFQRGNQNGPRPGTKDEEGRDGAYRRIMHKRKNEDGSGGDGPPTKKQNINQPSKEKKTRKEFVGMTAEKKKKRKFDKGQKKKKALSEILTK